MKVYYCDSFRGHYPIGTCAVIVADSEQQALELLLAQCEQEAIPQSEEDVARIKLHRIVLGQPARAIIVNNGNY